MSDIEFARCINVLPLAEPQGVPKEIMRRLLKNYLENGKLSPLVRELPCTVGLFYRFALSLICPFVVSRELVERSNHIRMCA